MSTATSFLPPAPLIDERELNGVLPMPSRAWLLKRLQDESAFGERLVRHQPSLETVSREVFQLALDDAFAGLKIDPDTVWLLEASRPNAAQRSIAQVVRDALASGAIPAESQITGFSTVAGVAGGQGLLDIGPKTFVALLDQHMRGLFERFSQRLNTFWRNPVRQDNELTMRDRWLRCRYSELAEEAALRRADNLADPLLGLTPEGLALVQALMENHLRPAAELPKVAMYRLVIRGGEQDNNLAAAFVLASWGGLSKSAPVVLYTPQRGLQEFVSHSVLLNTLRLQQVQEQERDEILANVAMPDRAVVFALRKEGRALWELDEMLPDAQGSLLGQVVCEQLAQQQRNLRAACLPFRPGTDVRVSQVLVLPTGLPGDLLKLPFRPDTLPVVPSSRLEVGEQQQNLIGQLAKLNNLTGKLLVGLPEFDGFFQQQLKTLFPSIRGLISPQRIHFTRSRLDEQGVRQPAESKTLEVLLGELMEAAESGSLQGGAFYVEPDTVDEDLWLQSVGTPQALVAALKQTFPSLLQAFWSTFQAGQGLRVEVLTRVRKQVLASEAALRTVDGTLTLASRALIDNVLKYPTSKARELAFPVDRRPEVYGVTLSGGERLATAFFLSPNSVNPPTGPLVLWTLTEGFEEFASLAALQAEVSRRLDALVSEGATLIDSLSLEARAKYVGQWLGALALAPVAIADDFVADGIKVLLATQLQDARRALSHKFYLRPVALDKLIDLAPRLDVAEAFVVRNRLLEARLMPAWQKALSAQAWQQLQALEQVVQEKNQALSALLAPIPSLPDYTRQKLRAKLRVFLEAHGLPGSAVERIDLDKVIVTRVEAIRVNTVPAPGMTSPIERTDIERMSLTELALNNLKPWEASLAWTSKVSIAATVRYADGSQVVDTRGEALVLSRETIEQWVVEINAGHRYCQDVLKKTFAPPRSSERAGQLWQAWMSAQGATLAYAAESARLNPTAYGTVLVGDPEKKRAEQWVAAVLASWVPQGRPQVGGQAIKANFLVLGKPGVAPEFGGEQWAQGLVVISTDEAPERVLYAPDAPDGLELRELRNEAGLVALLGSPAWQPYLLARLGVRTLEVDDGLLSPAFKFVEFGSVLASIVPSNVRAKERLPPLIVQLLPCEASLLQGMYYLQFLRLLELVQRSSVTNEEVNRQSAFNKLMFGIEVVGTLLDMLPGFGSWATSKVSLWRRLARTAVRTFRTGGQSIPALILRRGLGRQWLVMAFAGAGAASAGVRPLAVRRVFSRSPIAPLQPLLQVPRAPAPVSIIPQAWKTSAMPANQALELLRGVEPNSRGIFRTAAGECLIRPVDAQGRVMVFRIKNDIRFYDGGGETVQVIDARSRVEVGLLQVGEHAEWRPLQVRGGGRGASRQAVQLPQEEYLMTDDYLRNTHGRSNLSQDAIQYYDDWFKRDWQAFFLAVQIPPRPARLALAASATVDDLIRAWPDDVTGLVLGEVHLENASVAFLTGNMQALYERGFRSLYIEGSHASGTREIYIPPGSMKARHIVARRARSCGLRVRGLDDDYLTLHRDRHTQLPHINDSARLREMNYFSVRQIQANHPSDGGKWIAWVGMAHMNTTNDVPGIAELMGGIGVGIRDAKAGQSTVIRASNKPGFVFSNTKADVEIELDVTNVAPRVPEGPHNP
ncbi:membrane-targeted effector domain-containing toxin [Pseudomonas trivialis]|uniref:membrane-targeted effector domain-containing toxin n=1 Tax=Pseudomonas trivialis TaxID=200450 RepID=UPI000A67217D|nr:membrane-targeted effector domain-containing toxin [Pseudomonas trivialis]